MASLFQLLDALRYERASRKYLRIEVESRIYDRISRAVRHSDVEEGGKLIGHMKTDGKDTVILQVLSYIDSGPGVDNSQTHLHPDGEYQEAAFRLVESYLPDIEHLGSWHSHHCNGLSDLSSGDIDGYIRSVNKPDYNIGIFLAVLAYGNDSHNLRHRYYIFQKGSNKYLEVPDSYISITRFASPVNDLLQLQESLSFKYRNNRHDIPIYIPYTDRSRRHDAEDDLKLIRAEDAKRIRDIFPEAQVIHDTRNGTLFWRWPAHPERADAIASYAYPTRPNNDGAFFADIQVKLGNKALIADKIELNKKRFDNITSLMKKASKILATVIKEEEKEQQNRANAEHHRGKGRHTR